MKPENVMLERDHAVVADFGIARAVGAAGAANLTQTGMAIGTASYMSPEQALAESEVDARGATVSMRVMPLVPAGLIAFGPVTREYVEVSLDDDDDEPEGDVGRSR